MNPKPLKERVADSEGRKREQGLRKTWVWVYPEDREAIHRYAEKKRRAREQAEND